MGDAIAIIVGQQLGAGEIEEAKDSSRKIIAMSVFFGALGGLMMFPISFIFPEAYNTTGQVKDIAGTLIRVTSCFVPIHAFLHAMYFAIRSGGKTFITFLFDSCYMWVIVFPVAFILSRYTNVDIMYLFITCQAVDLVKVIIGLLIYKSGIWAKNITV
jgi:Na+-driven multidrug efflux pump